MAEKKNKDGLVAGALVSQKDHDRIVREKRQKLAKKKATATQTGSGE